MSSNSDPGNGVVLMTPSDTVNTPIPSEAALGIRSWYCNVAGTVSYVCADESVGSITALAGYVYPWRVVRINSTGTTATGFYGIV